MKCPRCQGRGTNKVPRADSTQAKPTWTEAECHVCLGLGNFETNEAMRKPPDPMHSITLHSDIPVEDVIALLPVKEEHD